MALRNYQTVDDRLREWWSAHPHGRVATWIAESHGEQRWTIAAAIYRDAGDETPAATGMAYGDPAGSSGAQATNPLEDAETSAIGRALANAGYSPKGARPSAEEMAVAENRANGQHSEPPQHPAITIRERIKAAGLVEAFTAYLADQHGVNRLDELDTADLMKVLAVTGSPEGIETIRDYAPAEVDA